MAHLFEFFPLTCRYCGVEMKIIAFVIETPSVRGILEYIGEPARPYAVLRRCAFLLRLGASPNRPQFGR